jgi:Zn-finger nucleic acid-binding protein
MDRRSVNHCPACKAILNTLTWKDTQLEICSDGCHGVWFDFKELQAIESSDTLEALDAAFEEGFKKRSVKELLEEEVVRNCPKDGSVLERFEWNVGSGVVMDSCPRCQGIWLDAGELEGYAEYVKKFRETSPRIPADVIIKMSNIRLKAKAMEDAIEDDAARRVIRWDIGPLDDMLRGLIRFIAQ